MTLVLESLPPFSEPFAFRRPRGVARAEPEGDDLDVPACIRKVREGDEEAARALMQRLYPLVLKLVRAYLPRRTSEEDLVQTVFMKIFARLHQYSGLVPVEHWVSRVTVNTCLNQLQSEKIRPEWRWSDLSEEQQRFLESSVAAEPPSDIDAESASQLIARLLEMLKPKERLVIRLLHLEEKSINEIARITGWTVPVVKVRAFRARNKLKQHLRDLEPAMASAA